MKNTAPFNFRRLLTCLLFGSLLLIPAAAQNNLKAGGKPSDNFLKSRAQGNDLVKLNGAFDVPSVGGSEFAVNNPLSAAVADLDGDGIADLIIGRNGAVTVQRGDINAFAPKTQAAWEAIRDLRYLSPFLSKTESIAVPLAADFVQTGDFNRDGKQDILAASRSRNELVLLAGDGRGNFSAAREIFVGGNIAALAVGDFNRPDGLPDVIVGSGSEVSIYQSLGDVFQSEPKRVSLSNQVESIAVGQLDENDFNDLAIAGGNQISIVSGSDGGESTINDLPQNFAVKSLIIGDFVPDRAFRSELAALDESGAVHIFGRGNLDTRSVSPREHLAEQARQMLAKNLPVPPRVMRRLSKADLREPAKAIETDNRQWAEYDLIADAVAPDSLTTASAVLTSGKLSNYGEDLIVLDSSNHEINVLPLVSNDESGAKISYAGKRQSVKLTLDSAPLAAIAGRFNFDSEQDLLVLQSGKPAASTLISAPQAAFVVNSAGDAPDSNPGNGVCATAGAVCTLRAAIMEANHLPGSDSITINSGLNITLSSGNPDNDTNAPFNPETGGDLDITCAINAGGDTCNAPLAANVNNLTITGAVGGNTISGGTFAASAPLTGTTDRVFDIGMDGIFGGGFGGSTGLQVTMSNLTIQNGNVREDFNASNGGYGNFARGGAIRIDGFGQGGTRGALTLTSVTLNNNQADHDTGGVFDQYASISYNSVINTNNIGKGGPGGALSFGASAPATLTIAGSTFTGNEARNGTVFGTAATDCDGGAISANLDTNVATIGTTNFTNNISFDDGGALRAFNGAMTVTGGTMSGNTARDDGGAVWGDNDTVGAGRFLTLSGVTLNSNTANSDTSGGGDGGAIFRDRGTLNVTNCSIGTVALPNTANNGGAIAHAFRAGAAASNVTAINVDNGSITGNNARKTTNSGDGGAVYLDATNFTAGNPTVLTVGSTTSVAVTENNANVNGGGFAVNGGATANITRATIYGNDADKDANASGDGGGIYQNNSGGTTTVPATVTIGQSGQGNTAANGGGIAAANGILSLTSVPIASNTASSHGGGLFISGGTANVSGETFTANTSTNGTEVRLTGGTTNFSGTLTIPGELSIAGGTLAAGSSTVNLGEDFNFSSGTFNAGTSSFNFNGTAAQQIYGGAVPTFNIVTDSNTIQPLAINNNANFNGTLTVNANATLNPAAAAIVGGTGTLTGSGTVRVTRTAATADFSNQYPITNKTLTNLLVDYVGAGAQIVSGTTYGALRINNASSASLGGTATVNGLLTLQAVNLAVGTNTLTVNSGVTATGGAQFTSAATGTVNYGQASSGQTVLASNYGNLTFSNFNKVLPAAVVGIAGTFTPGTATGHTITGNTIDFNGAPQTIPAFTFNNLSTSGSGAKTLGGTVTVNSNVTIGTGTTLTLSGNTLNVGGNFTNNGAFSGSIAAQKPAVIAAVIGGRVVFNGTAAQTVAGTVATTFNDLQINNANGITFNQNGTVNGVLTLTSGNVSMGANTLTVGSAGNVSRTSGHILGKLAKIFGGAGSFTYAVGTANGYSPVNTTVSSGSGTLTINAVQGVHPNVPMPGSAIARYWTLTGTGMTASFTFNYLQADVLGNESQYKLIKINNGAVTAVYPNAPTSVIIDTTANTATINNISSFSDWTLGEAVPTAAASSIGGRVLTAGGRAINQATLKLTNASGRAVSVRTNNFGSFNFANLPGGQNYILSVSAKGYQFNQSSSVINLQQSISDFNFTANR